MSALVNSRARVEPSLVSKPEPEVSWYYAPRISAGEYPAYSRKSKVYRDRQFNRWVCAVQFDILAENLQRVVARLTWYLNLGSGEKPKTGRRSFYWKAWIAANGGLPKRGDRVSHHIFERRHCIVAVADTTKNFEQMTVKGEESYSVVRTVIRWETGGMR